MIEEIVGLPKGAKVIRLWEHVTDFIYRPIESAAGQVIGLFVEGYDRTEWERA
jgi:hypothetical protein